MKKFFIFFAFLLFFYGINSVHATLIKHHLQMYMTVNGKREEVIFYEDLDTRMPVFRTSYEGELFGEYHSLDRLSISLEEEEKIKIILAAIIEGKKYIELDWLHLVGAQTLI